MAQLESQAKAKWVCRLDKIAEAAGSAASINSIEGDEEGMLTLAEKSRVRKLVLGMGAFRTLGTYVRHWERFADWASSKGLAVYPPEVKAVVKYILELDERGCGPTVITSVRSAIKWLGKRIGMVIPNMDDPQIKAVEMDVVERRAQEVRAAIALPIDLVRVMERYVVKFSDCKPQAACFVGWLLCMVYASLRFNDACHVKPDSLEMQDAGFFGLAWQTKVEKEARHEVRDSESRFGTS